MDKMSPSVLAVKIILMASDCGVYLGKTLLTLKSSVLFSTDIRRLAPG